MRGCLEGSPIPIEAKPFQRATVDAAARAYSDPDGSRRFLVADEVGLGKTVVARGVIEELSRQRRPLRVFYVCSNLAIGAQNLRRLVSFLPSEEAKSATASVDRPSLMPTRVPPSHGCVQVYLLTPGTALPSRRGRAGEGRFEERAFGVALIDEQLGGRVSGLGPAMRGRVGPDRFYRKVRDFKAAIRNGDNSGRGFAPLFCRALRTELGLAPGQWLPPRIRRLVKQGNNRELVRAVRGALAIAALERVRPDLVIFDEFQRFRDFLTDRDEERDCPESRDLDESALRVLTAIRGEGEGRRTPLLLLSATPYTPYRGRDNDSSYGEAAGDFFEIVKFLYGGGPTGREVADHARLLFGAIEEELRKGTPLSEHAEGARDKLTMLLQRVLSRTEQPRSAGDTAADSGGGNHEVSLIPADVMVFRHLKESLQQEDLGWAVGLWQSVPLPMQSLGRRYKVWRRASNISPDRRIALTNDMRRHFGTGGPLAHPGLRALLQALPVRRLALPWVAPSLPWWPLGRSWRGGTENTQVDGKLLVFGRFRAVPVALSGLVSYVVEAWLRERLASKRSPTYDGTMRRQFLAAAPQRPSLLSLFHPSPLLASVDPTARGLGNIRTAKSAVRAQVRSLLADHEIRVVPRTSRARRPVWELLAAIERRAGLWESSRSAWLAVAAGLGTGNGVQAGGRLSSMVQQWNDQSSAPVAEIAPGEFDALCGLALEAPGVVLGRALARHWRDALAPQNLKLVAGLSWRALRAYFDQPWFVAALGGPEKSYPDRIRRAVVEGNLESVLDEHFWYLGMAGGSDWTEAITELEATLRLRTSTVQLHERGPDPGTVRLRCHVAAALNEARAVSAQDDTREAPLRPDEVRRAFNAPFWPHVLVTTSIGQEGLDFHPWCRALAHWDLCSGPVALEQREGRIRRFAGLAVRRAIAAQLSSKETGGESGESPWTRLAVRAEAELADCAGLAPWWVAPGSMAQRIVFSVPGSETPARLARLNRERALYRLVLGMPDQADLLELIAADEAWDPKKVRETCLDLSAWKEQRA